ncbi:MAG: hypothetical protein AAFV86_16395 [Pseudomonadota bacterium]
MQDATYDYYGADVFNQQSLQEEIQRAGIIYNEIDNSVDIGDCTNRLATPVSDGSDVLMGCGQADLNLLDICDALKADDRRATVYTIGFELDPGENAPQSQKDNAAQAEAVLRDCASTLAQHYHVEGLDIAKAFDNIGKELRTLKLIN